MFGGDESYDREGDDSVGGTPWDPSDEPVAQDPAEFEKPAAPAAPKETGGAPAPPPEPTGDERVDSVLARFSELDGAPVADHVEVFEDVQRGLQEVLAAVDHEDAGHDEPAPGARPWPPGGQL